MNILRWRRKSKKKIKFKTLILFVFSLIMTTFAWFAYSKVLNPALNIHVSAWDIQYFINEEEKENPIGISIPTLYPSMPEYTVTIDIKNNGDRKVDIDYYLQTVTILGENYQLIQEGNAIPTGTENYIVLTPTALETSSTTDEVTGITTVTKTVKGAITNDITRLPFTVEVEHSAEIEALYVDSEGNEISGEGYLKITVNWIGDNNELDSEWGYRVNEYLTSEGATSAISIDLVIDSYQIEEETEITVTMPSTAFTAPYLPDGFVRVPGTTLDTGLVIKDSSGNEYVWVEVPKNTAVYANAGINLDLDSLSEEDLETACGLIESDLKTYSASYRVREESFATYATVGISNTVYNEKKIAMLKSVYKNGGFYIGRYETGIEDAPRTGNSDTLQTAVIKANVYPYNYVTTPQAQSLASGMVSGTDYTSSLMFGLQWDLVLKYLQVKTGIDPKMLKTDSTEIGNYYDNTFFVTNQKSQYSTNGGSSYTSAPYEKATPAELCLTTGANTSFSKQNIYDIAGNLAEWTYNIAYINSEPVGGNGGDYSQIENSVANSWGSHIVTTGSKYVGFRVALFSNIDNGAVGGEGGSIGDVTTAGSYLPTGFAQVTGTNLSNGLTIRSDSGNEYVWIEVPRDTTVYSEATLALNLDNLTGEDLTNAYTSIGNDLEAYASSYNDETYSDIHSGNDASTGLTSDEYYALKNKMLKSVFENGGFYVGKYEAGIKNSYRTATADPISDYAPVTQANAYPYYLVTCSQAQELATSMESGEYTSSLMFGIQWDLILKYLYTSGAATSAELTSSSSGWGNYSDSTYTIANSNAKYNIVDTSTFTPSEWIRASSYTHNSGVYTLLTTGSTNTFCKKGIYDLAGNVYEWTLEYSGSSGSPSVYRGGVYCYGGYFPANRRSSNNVNHSIEGVGFRAVIF